MASEIDDIYTANPELPSRLGLMKINAGDTLPASASQQYIKELYISICTSNVRPSIIITNHNIKYLYHYVFSITYNSKA